MSLPKCDEILFQSEPKSFSKIIELKAENGFIVGDNHFDLWISKNIDYGPMRLNDGNIIEHKIKEGDGAYAYGTKEALNTFVDICLNKNVTNHSNGDLALKTVKILEALAKSMKREKLDRI